jgi:hypothetical protein
MSHQLSENAWLQRIIAAKYKIMKTCKMLKLEYINKDSLKASPVG